ncbi:hypothetical protein BGI41_06805 [Methanobrevibacter sp. 87.7]|uniref:hypothetical protein n=1 Tax=Methanobrevibacter sp. 87.7 TaxID=387957 RepID=UPI000B4FF310|nr:hypothetical protein [Methanobrevibacter sp. 87.7]OWT32607.1 hypothetical protein BGI41_06805 [Methanobrevibacter sp. 87.7]
MRSRRRRRQEKLVLGFIILIVAFGLGSTMGISMGFNGNSTEVIQNNTTHVPIDVTHNISAYENSSDENYDNVDNVNTSSSSEGVVQYSGSNSSSSDYSYEYQTNDVDSSQYY